MRHVSVRLLGQIAVLVGALTPATAVAQTSYSIETLSAVGGTAGGANSINNRGWASGTANQEGDTVSHAALWVSGSTPIDLGSFGGPDGNSAVAWPVKNNNGVIVGISDTADDNPLGEAFSCWPFFASGTPTRKICKGFRWKDGVMVPLPPFPGGYNSYATAANNVGQVVGWAENGVHDPTCDPAFQILQFRAVIWAPDGEMQELPPLPGDSTSAATAINDKGQVVGISGACGIAVGGVSAAHAVLWENGIPVDIGNLGGHSWNTPTAINEKGTIVGFSLPAGQDGTTNYEAFVWTKESGMSSLGKPEGDIRSAAFGVNDKEQIVGLSRGGPYVFRALLWEDGIMTDINELTLPGSPFLLYANDINNRGEIVGQAFNPDTEEAPAFVGTPSHSDASASSAVRGAPKADLPERVRQQLRQRWGADLGADQ
jgi:probable HAF family extracellular repeat protein